MFPLPEEKSNSLYCSYDDSWEDEVEEESSPDLLQDVSGLLGLLFVCRLDSGQFAFVLGVDLVVSEIRRLEVVWGKLEGLGELHVPKKR